MLPILCSSFRAFEKIDSMKINWNLFYRLIIMLLHRNILYLVNRIDDIFFKVEEDVGGVVEQLVERRLLVEGVSAARWRVGVDLASGVPILTFVKCFCF